MVFALTGRLVALPLTQDEKIWPAAKKLCALGVRPVYNGARPGGQKGNSPLRRREMFVSTVGVALGDFGRNKGERRYGRI